MVLSNTTLCDFMSRREFLEEVLTTLQEMGGDPRNVDVERIDRLRTQNFSARQAARCELAVQQRVRAA